MPFLAIGMKIDLTPHIMRWNTRIGDRNILHDVNYECVWEWGQGIRIKDGWSAFWFELFENFSHRFRGQDVHQDLSFFIIPCEAYRLERVVLSIQIDVFCSLFYYVQDGSIYCESGIKLIINTLSVRHDTTITSTAY